MTVVDRSQHTQRAPKFTNCTQQQIKLVSKLHKDNRITIKPADKGSSWVIMNTADYQHEATRQLLNRQHYLPLPEPLFTSNAKFIKQFHDELLNTKCISKNQYNWLQEDITTHRQRIFYLLPKIHKPVSKWTIPNKIPPGRPVISDINSENYRTSMFIDYHLKPFATSHPAYIKDTWDFLSKLRTIKPNRHCLLATIDVDAMYTNINNKDGMTAIRKCFNKKPCTLYDIISRLMEFILASNDFEFNGHNFLQINGTAMGKIFSPHYADIYMADWEKSAFEKCTKLPLLYLRYLDDIFIIWEHTRNDFTAFFNILNTHHTSIKLKYELSETSVNFLDVTIYKGANFENEGILDTKVYFKPTDTHELLHKSSYHPKHTFNGIVKAQITRYKRICNNESDMQTAIELLFTSLKSRGYSSRQLQTIQQQVFFTAKSSNTTKPCQKASCTLCSYLTPSSHEITSRHTTLKLQSPGSCSSTNCIYAIRCRTCSKTYVGQTTNLRNRLHNHVSDITLLRKDTPLTQHFNYHPVSEIHALVLQQFPNTFTTQQKLALENQWIAQLRTLHPQGLNSHMNTTPRILPFITPFNEISHNLNTKVKHFFNDMCHHIPHLDTCTRLVTSNSSRKNLTQMLVRSSQKLTPIPKLVPSVTLDTQQPSSSPHHLPDPMEWITTKRKFLERYVSLPGK